MAKKDKITERKDKETAASQIMQKFKTNPLLYIGSVLILVLVVVTFVGGDLLSGRRNAGDIDLTFGYYDKVPINYVQGSAFVRNVERAVSYYQNEGVDFSNYFNLAQIWRQAFDMTVMHTAVLQMMKRSNYSVPEETVNKEVSQLPRFQENGRFSPALYNAVSTSQQRSLWREVHDELVKATYFTDYYYGMLIPSAEADFIGKMSSYNRTFDMVVFNVEDYPESEYLNYARENASLFQTIHLSKITVSSGEREAKKILDSIRNGAVTFEEAARAQSQDGYADRGGDMGARYYFEFTSEIPALSEREKVFSLSRGDISDVINIGDRWVIYRMEEALRAADFNDELTMERVRSYLRNYARGHMEDWAIAQANNFIIEANEEGFSNAALWQSLEINTFGPLPINYGGVELFAALEAYELSGFSKEDIESLSRNENFWRIAFSTKLNTPSEPLVQGSYVLVLFPVEEENDEEMWNNISYLYSSYWLNQMNEQSMAFYFINNSRMDDRFWDVFFKTVMP